LYFAKYKLKTNIEFQIRENLSVVNVNVGKKVGLLKLHAYFSLLTNHFSQLTAYS